MVCQDSSSEIARRKTGSKTRSESFLSGEVRAGVSHRTKRAHQVGQQRKSCYRIRIDFLRRRFERNLRRAVQNLEINERRHLSLDRLSQRPEAHHRKRRNRRWPKGKLERREGRWFFQHPHRSEIRDSCFREMSAQRVLTIHASFEFHFSIFISKIAPWADCSKFAA